MPHRNYVNPNIQEDQLYKVQDHVVDWDDPFGSDATLEWCQILESSYIFKHNSKVTDPKWWI
jgi:hypothetical protein